MELSLHLGAHRTGSTALQQACRNNASILADENIEVWGSDVMRAPALERFPNIWSGEKSAADKKAVNAAITAMQNAIQERIEGGRGHLLITEENLLGSMPGNLTAQSLYPKAAERMTAYRQLLPTSPNRVFLCVRNYAGYWASSYAFAALRNDLPEFAKLREGLVQGARGWLDILADLRAVFPDSQILVWEHKKTADLLGDVLKLMFGQVVGGMDLPKNLKNRALNAEALEQALGLRKSDPDLTALQLHDAVAVLDKAGGAPFQPFSGQQVQLLNRHFADDLAQIAAGAIPGVELIEQFGSDAGAAA